MKKIVCIIVSLCFSCIVFAATFTKNQNYDDFGDLVKGSSTITSKSLPCTYTTSSEKDEKAEFTIQISNNGDVSLIVTAKKWEGIPGVERASVKFTVMIRPDAGEDVVINNVGLGQDNNKRYSLLKVGNIVSSLARCKSVRIIVKNDKVTINFGTIDTSEIERLYYEKTEYDYICKLINEGNHQEAIQRIETLESQAKKSYDYFGLEDTKKGIHKIDEGRVANEPTCADDGLFIYSCSVCGEILESETIPAIGHRYNPYRCVNCGEELSVGSIGPAGGYVFYDCDADNDNGDDDGLKSSECGWRFLEAAPNDYSFWHNIDYDISGDHNFYGGTAHLYSLGYYRKSDYGVNLFVNGTTTYDESNCTGYQVGTGKTNTQLLVSVMGEENCYSSEDSYGGGHRSAAKLCTEIEYSVNGVVYKDWFLPSLFELGKMYVVLQQMGFGGFRDYYYLSSSECDLATEVYIIDFRDGFGYCASRGFKACIRPIRSF